MQDVGTVDSGLNSMVLASNNEMVLLPVNEPTFGTRRKSQIQVRRYRGASFDPGNLGCLMADLCLLFSLTMRTEEVAATDIPGAE
jgi:hypothetical protein